MRSMAARFVINFLERVPEPFKSFLKHVYEKLAEWAVDMGVEALTEKVEEWFGGTGTRIPHHHLDPEFSGLGEALVKQCGSVPVWFDLKSIIPSLTFKATSTSPDRSSRIALNGLVGAFIIYAGVKAFHFGKKILEVRRKRKAEEKAAKEALTRRHQEFDKIAASYFQRRAQRFMF